MIFKGGEWRLCVWMEWNGSEEMEVKWRRWEGRKTNEKRRKKEGWMINCKTACLGTGGIVLVGWMLYDEYISVFSPFVVLCVKFEVK